MMTILRQYFMVLLLATIAHTGVQAGEARPIPSVQIDAYTHNIRAGFAATTGFDLVTTASVPRDSRKVGATGRLPSPYWQQITYPLYRHPETYSYRTEEIKHLQRATLGWRTPEQYPFVFDLYLHGDSEPDQLAIRIPNLDIRKFLHQSIAPLAYHRVSDLPGALALAQLQAYFAEDSMLALSLSAVVNQEERSVRLHVTVQNVTAEPLSVEIAAKENDPPFRIAIWNEAGHDVYDFAYANEKKAGKAARREDWRRTVLNLQPGEKKEYEVTVLNIYDLQGKPVPFAPGKYKIQVYFAAWKNINGEYKVKSYTSNFVEVSIL